MAAWTLCLGYVYADAKRRGMRPVLWTLIAALFPHLFGFLLYFALRQPMTPLRPLADVRNPLDLPGIDASHIVHVRLPRMSPSV